MDQFDHRFPKNMTKKYQNLFKNNNMCRLTESPFSPGIPCGPGLPIGPNKKIFVLNLLKTEATLSTLIAHSTGFSSLSLRSRSSWRLNYSKTCFKCIKQIYSFKFTWNSLKSWISWLTLFILIRKCVFFKTFLKNDWYSLAVQILQVFPVDPSFLFLLVLQYRLLHLFVLLTRLVPK